MHHLTPNNLAGLEQDTGVHLAGWLGDQSSQDSGRHQHFTMLCIAQSRHYVIQQELQTTTLALNLLQNDPDPKNMLSLFHVYRLFLPWMLHSYFVIILSLSLGCLVVLFQIGIASLFPAFGKHLCLT